MATRARTLVAIALCLAPHEAARTGVMQASLGNEDECGQDIIVEPGQGNLQQIFDAERETGSILDEGFVTGAEEEPENDAAKCTKSDVCLLMRQLDLEFYQRARVGKLTDEDFRTPPTPMKLHTGNCFHAHQVSIKHTVDKLPVAEAREDSVLGQRMDKGFRIAEIHSEAKCQRLLGVPVSTVDKADRPRGCYYEVTPSSNEKPKKGYFNTNINEVEAGIISKDGKGQYSASIRKQVVQVCEMDRTLSPSAAAYYSPYKMKQSMIKSKRERMSTTCSFGLMAWLARKQKTQSACAKILATEEGERKMALIELITNTWCPNVWTEAEERDLTCRTPRSISWAPSGVDDEDTRAKLLKGYEDWMAQAREPKQALPEAACRHYFDNKETDESLAALRPDLA